MFYNCSSKHSVYLAKYFLGRGTVPFPDPIPTLEGTPFPRRHPREVTTVDHNVKQYIDESLPAQLEKSGNFVHSKTVTL